MQKLVFFVSLYVAPTLAIALPLHLGECALDATATAETQLVQGCVQPTLDTDALTDFRDMDTLHQTGRLYLGSHYQHHSLHFQGFFRQTTSLNHSTTSLDRSTELAAWRIGNFAFDHWTLTMGKQPIPFGLHFNPIQGAYYQLGSESFWSSPAYGASLGWDNWEKIRIEGGVASEITDPIDSTKKRRLGVGGRFLYDFSALNGTRLIVSAAGENIGPRKLGAALLHNAHNSLFQLEWIRQKNLQENTDADYIQLFRLSITGPYHHKTRTIFLYEDVHNSHRMGILQQDWQWIFPLYYHVALGYRKEETDLGPNRWFMFTGMALHL